MGNFTSNGQGKVREFTFKDLETLLLILRMDAVTWVVGRAEVKRFMLRKTLI